MEPEVNIRCRQSDHDLVKRIMDDAVEEYKNLMKAEVKAYQNKDVTVNLVLDEGKYLPEFNEESESTTDSCMGGVILHAIVCSNTLDERLQLVYGEAIPEIREQLFPCLKKPEKPVKPVEARHGHHGH